MEFKDEAGSKIPMLKRVGVLMIGVCLAVAGCGETEIDLPASTEVLDEGVEPVPYRLRALSLDAATGVVYGARGKSLYRIIDNGDAIEHVYTFKDKINAIHFAPEGLFVATDISHWDSKTPCVIYRSRDQGKSFRTVWTLEQSSAMWWSIASSKAGDLYIGEYGPRDRGLSKRVHRSQDGGDTWQTVFEAADNDKTHIHRVAVDPYDGAVWVTIGDGRRNRGAFVSHDRGRTWQRVLDSQATGIAFTPSAVYFGEDHKKKGRVSRYDKRSKTYREVFRASSFGNYGGSIYDLAIGADGSVYVPTMKYENQDHIISLWHGSADHWSLLLRLESKPGVAGGLGTIAGPDRDGWVYVTGFKIRDH